KSFTIIIPCFNVEKYISKCLESLLNQNYDTNLLQILVIDDGSTNDELKRIVNKYQDKHKNIEYYFKENNHWGSVINYVLENKLVKNDYVSILDADDFLKIDAFKIINEVCDDHDVVSSAYTRWYGSGNKGRFFSYPYLFKKVITNKYQKQSPISIPISWYAKKEVFYKIKKLVEGIPFQDGNYTSQIIMNAKSVKHTKKITSFYFIAREGNTVTSKWDIKRVDQEYQCLLNLIDNDAQEIVALRFLFFPPIRKAFIENKKELIVNRKFHFKWIPFYIRWIINIIFLFTTKKFFTFKKI
ncbi:MAG: glycosyltransferase, partial [Mycoplasmoidaceae bacterium]